MYPFSRLSMFMTFMCCVFTDNSDLNLRVDEAGVKGTPITAEGFAFMWAGVRGSYGVSKGKVCYEVKVCVTTVVIWWFLSVLWRMTVKVF